MKQNIVTIPKTVWYRIIIILSIKEGHQSIINPLFCLKIDSGKSFEIKWLVK